MRILVVEDEPKIASAIKRGLEQELFAVDVAADSDEGLANALTDEYDVIVLDRMLPGLLDGADICREVRAAGVRTPIIMLTALDKISDRVEGLSAGADDYLIKPFAFEELLARIRALLRRPQDHVGNVLTLDDLTLDTETYEVKRAGRPIQLSSREYALLEYLLRNQNRTLSKASIISHVWDYDADILPNTLEVYISYLRAKIERPFGGPELIHTVRGFGYKLSTASE